MKSIGLLWLGVILFTVSAFAGDAPAGYSQSYTILLKGTPAGSEVVTEAKSAAGDLISTSEHELLVTDGLETKRMTFSTKMVLSKSTGNPVSYAYRYTTGGTGDSYDVLVKDAQITRVLTKGGHTTESTMAIPINMVIVDFNVYHHYDYLIRRYDFKKGGRQIFANYVPIIGNDIPLAVTYLGNAEIPIEKGSLSTKNYKIEFVGIWGGSLFADKDGRLVRLVVPAQDLEVVRKDLLPPEAGKDK
jgi:hypothetical protein